ncbi:MAG: hypothetical protein A2W61_05620 [Deltaproteobacteria bacterium RIFCSPLOWO2_01_44_7]|nr:MAG: hypothetical protein A2712_02990 [Deltaproteobacteria bacterium RIFCSPHIGHO2_01_FULL_43_49]OGQ37538.1 MAG: hypothetical protein A2W61_05620 [Deltaproteobacteria bacterium RIFCSPLOWO2_01_44_7]
MTTLSVVMPTLNEEKAIAVVVRDIQKYAAAYNPEIIIVDSSTDKTPDIARSLGCKVITMPKCGPGKAIIEGLHTSKGEVVIVSDCDGTYPMDAIPEFIGWYQKGYDFVNGSRLHKKQKAMPWLNWLGNRTFALLVAIPFGIRTKDIASGMRLYSRKLINAAKWETNYSFWIEIIVKTKKLGLRFKEIPIDYRPRIGEPTVNLFRSGRCFLLCIIKYLFNIKAIDPAKL